ncbi:MAG: EboA domain-containing protein [Planctomycetales bacterium]|nr:EboA domain-containing protein [Planctomycetales bacterium]
MSTPATDSGRLLVQWLQRQLPPAARQWFDEALAEVQADPSDRTFYKRFSLVARKIGKDDLSLSADDLAAAQQVRPGWSPQEWSADQAARLALMLLSQADEEKFFARAEQLFITADVGEQVALYRGLPLYPGQAAFAYRGAEGLRTNIRSVFEAVAHRNPFPSEQFDENAWNQMVLKALFIGSPLWPMQGVDQRANPTLRTMLLDFAHERWAAHRPVPLELWRSVALHPDETALTDLAKVLASSDLRERQAAALAIAGSASAAAKQLLAEHPELERQAAAGEISWPAVTAQ